MIWSATLHAYSIAQTLRWQMLSCTAISCLRHKGLLHDVGHLMGPQSIAILFSAALVDVVDSYSTLKQDQVHCEQPDSIKCSDHLIHVLLARFLAVLSSESCVSATTGLPHMWLPLAGRKILTCFGKLAVKRMQSSPVLLISTSCSRRTAQDLQL